MCHCLIIVHRIYCIFFQFWFVLSHSNWFTFHLDAVHSNTVWPVSIFGLISFLYMGWVVLSLFVRNSFLAIERQLASTASLLRGDIDAVSENILKTKKGDAITMLTMPRNHICNTYKVQKNTLCPSNVVVSQAPSRCNRFFIMLCADLCLYILPTCSKQSKSLRINSGEQKREKNELIEQNALFTYTADLLETAKA